MEHKVACRALEQYMIDKLSAAESTFKEMQLRMGDPEVAGNATEFQKVAKAAADLEGIATAFAKVYKCPCRLQIRMGFIYTFV